MSTPVNKDERVAHISDDESPDDGHKAPPIVRSKRYRNGSHWETYEIDDEPARCGFNGCFLRYGHEEPCIFQPLNKKRKSAGRCAGHFKGMDRAANIVVNEVVGVAVEKDIEVVSIDDTDDEDAQEKGGTGEEMLGENEEKDDEDDVDDVDDEEAADADDEPLLTEEERFDDPKTRLRALMKECDAAVACACQSLVRLTASVLEEDDSHAIEAVAERAESPG